MIKTTRLALAAGLFAASFAAAIAAPSTLKCPACGMAMSSKKTAMMTVPVYSKKYKKVYYCCPMCKAGKAGIAYEKAHKKPMPV